MPPSRCSSSSNSRSERSSRSRSASLFLICHHFMSVLLGGRPHHARQSFGHLRPLRFFDQQLLPAFSQAVLCFLRHRRRSTLNPATMVDTRLSIVKGATLRRRLFHTQQRS